MATGQVETEKGVISDPAFMDPNSPEFLAMADGSAFKDSDDGKSPTELPEDPPGEPAAAATPPETPPAEPPPAATPAEPTPPPTAAAPTESGDQTSGAAPSASTETATPAPASDEGQDIETPNGKGTIPHAVLRGTRERLHQTQERLTAEEQARQAAEQKAADAIAALQAAQAGQPAQPQPGQTVEADIDTASQQAIAEFNEAYAELEENFPDMAKPVKILADRMNAIVAQMTPVTQYVNQAAAESNQTQANRVQTAIDNNPTLASWQADSDPTHYRRASHEFDIIRNDPLWAAKSVDEQVAEAVDRVSKVYPDAPIVSSPATTQESDEEVAKRAQAAAEAAAQEGADADPASLSQIPGGTVPPTNEATNMSTAQLESWMTDPNTSQAQLDKFLENASAGMG